MNAKLRSLLLDGTAERAGGGGRSVGETCSGQEAEHGRAGEGVMPLTLLGGKEKGLWGARRGTATSHGRKCSFLITS